MYALLAQFRTDQVQLAGDGAKEQEKTGML